MSQFCGSCAAQDSNKKSTIYDRKLYGGLLVSFGEVKETVTQKWCKALQQ
jgi:hypothetical protein